MITLVGEYAHVELWVNELEEVEQEFRLLNDATFHTHICGEGPDPGTKCTYVRRVRPSEQEDLEQHCQGLAENVHEARLECKAWH